MEGRQPRGPYKLTEKNPPCPFCYTLQNGRGSLFENTGSKDAVPRKQRWYCRNITCDVVWCQDALPKEYKFPDPTTTDMTAHIQEYIEQMRIVPCNKTHSVFVEERAKKAAKRKEDKEKITKGDLSPVGMTQSPIQKRRYRKRANSISSHGNVDTDNEMQEFIEREGGLRGGHGCGRLVKSLLDESRNLQNDDGKQCIDDESEQIDFADSEGRLRYEMERANIQQSDVDDICNSLINENDA